MGASHYSRVGANFSVPYPCWHFHRPPATKTPASPATHQCVWPGRESPHPIPHPGKTEYRPAFVDVIRPLRFPHRTSSTQYELQSTVVKSKSKKVNPLHNPPHQNRPPSTIHYPRLRHLETRSYRAHPRRPAQPNRTAPTRGIIRRGLQGQIGDPVNGERAKSVRPAATCLRSRCGRCPQDLFCLTAEPNPSIVSRRRLTTTAPSRSLTGSARRWGPARTRTCLTW